MEITYNSENYKYHTVNMLKCDIMTYSKVQTRAIEEIKIIVAHFGNERWFTQSEVAGIGYHTMEALVNKEYLQSQYFNNISYYKVLD